MVNNHFDKMRKKQRQNKKRKKEIRLKYHTAFFLT